MRLSRTIIPFILAYLVVCFVSVSYADPMGKIAFAKLVAPNSQIFIVDEDGENMEILTAGASPSWSPDGSVIAFITGFLDNEIHIIKADGRLRRPIGINGDYPLISPDGKKIAYIEVSFIQGVKIWLSIVDIDGWNQKRLKSLNNNSDRLHSWSPDGKHIAYCDRGNLYIINVETLESKEIICPTPNGKIEGLIGVDWAPRGNKLALVSAKFMANPLNNRQASRDHGIWVVNTDGSDAKRLTRDNESTPEWSPDGTEIAFAGRDGFAQKIFIMDSDGDNIRRLTDSVDMLEHEILPSWFGISAAVQPQNSLMTMWGKIKVNQK